MTQKGLGAGGGDGTRGAGKDGALDVLVMENIFYGHATSRIYDLKARLVNTCSASGLFAAAEHVFAVSVYHSMQYLHASVKAPAMFQLLTVCRQVIAVHDPHDTICLQGSERSRYSADDPSEQGAVLMDENLRESNLSAPILVDPVAYARCASASVLAPWHGNGVLL